jgi:hypothetical protein
MTNHPDDLMLSDEPVLEGCPCAICNGAGDDVAEGFD